MPIEYDGTVQYYRMYSGCLFPHVILGNGFNLCNQNNNSGHWVTMLIPQESPMGDECGNRLVGFSDDGN